MKMPGPALHLTAAGRAISETEGREMRTFRVFVREKANELGRGARSRAGNFSLAVVWLNILRQALGRFVPSTEYGCIGSTVTVEGYWKGPS